MLPKNNKEKILFFKHSIFEIARLIFNNPNKTFHLRMLERESKLSTTAVTEATDKLQFFKIVKIEKTNLTTNIKADLEEDAYHFYKRVFDLYRLKRYLIVDELVNIYNNPESIVLFGSFARGEDVEKSDIDLLIITSSKPKEPIDEFKQTIKKEMNRNINLHVLPSLEKSSNEFKNAIANGIVLHGYLKVV